jgi:phosphoglycolate phosphatase-like HAD superfamily hydrolase
MAKAEESPETTFHVGDEPEDTVASRAAHIVPLGAGWGLDDVQALEASKLDHLFLSVAELRDFLLKNGGLFKAAAMIPDRWQPS